MPFIPMAKMLIPTFPLPSQHLQTIIRYRPLLKLLRNPLLSKDSLKNLRKCCTPEAAVKTRNPLPQD